MPLRNGKEYKIKDHLKRIFPIDTRPFNMVLLPEKNKTYVLNIDFDESSKEWSKNKIKLEGGIFKYK